MMKRGGLKVSALVPDIACVLLGIVGVAATTSSTAGHLGILERGYVKLLAVLFVSISCLSLLRILLGRCVTFYINPDEIGWRSLFSRWKAVRIAEIESINLHKSAELSGSMKLVTKNGGEFHIPGNCYETRLRAVERMLSEFAGNGRFDFQARG